MAHELIDVVTATPAGPVTIGVGQRLDIAASFTLNGPPTGSPTFSSYSLSWQRVGLPASLDSQAPAVAGTVYTKTMGADRLPVGTHQFKVQGIYINNSGQPDSFVLTDSNLITVHVMREAREVEANLPDRTVTAGLPSREVDASLPSREVVAGLESRTVDASLPARTVTAGVVD